MERYAKAAANAVAKKLDTAIVTLFSGFSTTVGASTTNLADSEVRAAISALESANVDTGEAAFFMHPAVFWKQVQNIDKFSLAVNSPVNDPTPLGAGGSMGAMVGSSGVRVESNYIPQYLSTVTTADILYGVIENRDAAGVAIYTAA